jgi:Na+/melibiose symporter-like transporter
MTIALASILTPPTCAPRCGMPMPTGLWAIGNGLVSSLLVIYLATELGAKGLAISFILAAPRFAGLLRLGVPSLIVRLKSRKAVCIGAYVESSVILCLVPLAAVINPSNDRSTAVTVLVVAWCAYHFTEYVGTLALWSWLGDLTPPRIRGRLLARREQWLLGGRIAGLAASAGLAVVWGRVIPGSPRWQPLALSAAIGAVLMLVAVVPLTKMPAVSRAPSATPIAPWRTMFRALLDPAYCRLILYSCFFSIVNGATATAQETFPIRVLDMSYTVRQILQGVLRAGQVALAPLVGRLVDRWGNRPVMFVSQLITATGPLFYLAATPEQTWIAYGAFLVWIAYVGLNIGLDNIKLKLAPADNNAPYLTVYYAICDLANGVAILAGGLLLEMLFVSDESDAMRIFTSVFIVGWIGRTMAAALAATLIEPGAKRVRDLLHV